MSANIHHKREEGMCLSSALPLTEHFINICSRMERDSAGEPGASRNGEVMAIVLFHCFEIVK